MGEAALKVDDAMRILTEKVVVEKSDESKLLIGYDRESDTLSLWNGVPAN